MSYKVPTLNGYKTAPWLASSEGTTCTELRTSSAYDAKGLSSDRGVESRNIENKRKENVNKGKIMSLTFPLSRGQNRPPNQIRLLSSICQCQSCSLQPVCQAFSLSPGPNHPCPLAPPTPQWSGPPGPVRAKSVSQPRSPVPAAPSPVDLFVVSSTNLDPECHHMGGLRSVLW